MASIRKEIVLEASAGAVWDAVRDVVLSDPRVQQPSWIRSYLAPSFTAGASEHAYALEVLAEIFGGTSTSRLYRSLVIDQKLGPIASLKATRRLAFATWRFSMSLPSTTTTPLP